MVVSWIPAANVTDARLEPSNAWLPMEVTDVGMVMEVIALLPNADPPMVNSPLPAAKVTVWKPVPRNAWVPMVVTDAGMVRVPVEVILLL